jgi:hypothetical protein
MRKAARRPAIIIWRSSILRWFLERPDLEAGNAAWHSCSTAPPLGNSPDSCPFLGTSLVLLSEDISATLPMRR